MSKRKTKKSKKWPVRNSSSNKGKKKSFNEDLNYYIFLEEGNEFPSWINRWKDGFLKLPMSQVHYIEDKLLFPFNNVMIGEDLNYVFTLSHIIVTEKITINDNFVMLLAVNLILKPSRKNKVPKQLKQLYLEYEVGCPIWQ